MKIDKAIEILKGIQYQENDPNTPDIKDAVHLGTEALTYIIRLRAYSIQQRQIHLPSEDD